MFEAQADAWQTQGRLREGFGGGATNIGGWRLMASGLPYAYLNVGCVTDSRVADPSQAQGWYKSRDVPWSALVQSGSAWPHGRLVLTHRIMAVQAAKFSRSPVVSGLVLRKAGTGAQDVSTVVAVDASSFGTDSEASRKWMEPQFGFDEVEIAIGELDGVPVATGYTLRCLGEAGPTVYLGGIAVLPAARRKGIAAALSSWLLVRGFDNGAGFAHLETDSEGAARVYARLGFEEFNGIDIYAEC